MDHNVIETKFGMLVLPVIMDPVVRAMMARRIEMDIYEMMKGMKDYEVDSREVQELYLGIERRPSEER